MRGLQGCGLIPDWLRMCCMDRLLRGLEELEVHPRLSLDPVSVEVSISEETFRHLVRKFRDFKSGTKMVSFRTWHDWASDRLASARRAWWLTCSQIVEGSRTWTRTARQPLSHNCCCMSSRIERSHSMREASSWASTFPLLAICSRGWRELEISSSDISPAEGIGEASKNELKFRISMSLFVMCDFKSAKTVRKAAPSPWRGEMGW